MKALEEGNPIAVLAVSSSPLTGLEFETPKMARCGMAE